MASGLVDTGAITAMELDGRTRDFFTVLARS